MSRYLIPLILSALVASEQPGAAPPITPPHRTLPIGQLNFLQTTDIHGWYAGHLNQGQFSADFGDYYSFIQRMREKTDAVGADLIVVDTGDRIDGNGLYDASKPKGLYTFDIAKQVDYDVLILGNHELYQKNDIIAEYSNLSSVLTENYLSSNVDYIHPKTGERIPFGQRYRVFRTKNQGIRVAAFGFMFNFALNANITIVQRVEDTVKEDWFQAAIQEDVDLFLVCGHIPLNYEEFQVIVKAIRSQKKDIPIQTFGAHSHIRNYVRYDSKAYGFQSGKYLETIGWVSIDGIKKNRRIGSNNEITFQRRYIDNNVIAFQFHSGLDAISFPTDTGKNISLYIQNARKELDLDYLYGCVPRDLYLKTSHIPRNDSLLTWIVQDVLPEIVKTTPGKRYDPAMIILNSGSFRYDLVKGPFTRDSTFIMTPFIDYFRYIKNVPYKAALEVYNRLNQDHILFNTAKPASPLNKERKHPIQSRILGSKHVSRNLKGADNQISFTTELKRPTLVPGDTTVDDGGSDGDDTLHTPLGKIVPQPNLVHATVRFPVGEKPETVDFIFGAYTQIPILTAFNELGIHLDESNVQSYREEKVGLLIAKWIQDNWADKC